MDDVDRRQFMVLGATTLAVASGFVDSNTVFSADERKGQKIISPLLTCYLPLLLGDPIASGGVENRDRIADYVDAESKTIRNPAGNPFGDGCWRSAWLYAAIVVLEAENAESYDWVKTRHGISVDDAEEFIAHYANHCTSGDGFTIWKRDGRDGSKEQKYSRDQLCPLLCLMACIARYKRSRPSFEAAKVIAGHLSELERSGKGLSDSKNGSIQRNLGFLIHEICAALDVQYNFKSYEQWLALAKPVAKGNKTVNGARSLLPNLPGDKKPHKLEENSDAIARNAHREFLKVHFELSLSCFNAAADFEGDKRSSPPIPKVLIGQLLNLPIDLESGKPLALDWDKYELPKLDDLCDGFSVFNALAQLSLLRVLRGSVDEELSKWRNMLLANDAYKKWGPAFQLVSGTDVSTEEYKEEHIDFGVQNRLDNDIVLAQRPSKYIHQLFPPHIDWNHNPRRFVVLDYPILECLKVLWCK